MTAATSGAGWTLAPALATLLRQLRQAWPGAGWQTSPQTGTIGDQAHAAEGWTGSDHNAFLSPSGIVLPAGRPGGVVRALDIAGPVANVPGIVTVTDAPDCEALFGMVNRMYAARDPRVYPNGYAIYKGRVTDWDNPGGYHTQVGDPHLYHLHISVSRLPAGFNSTADWPLPAAAVEQPAGGGTEIPPTVEEGMFRLIQNNDNGVIRACGPGFWASVEGATPDRTKALVALFLAEPMCASKDVESVSTAKMQALHDFYIKGKVS